MMFALNFIHSNNYEPVEIQRNESIKSTQNNYIKHILYALLLSFFQPKKIQVFFLREKPHSTPRTTQLFPN